MGLLDGTDEDPNWKLRRYIITVAAGVVLIVGLSYMSYFHWFHVPERRAAARFLDALSAGNMDQAYQLWKPDPAHYSMNDFTSDWGSAGYYGPVKSYRIESAATPPRSDSVVVVTVEVSPYQPFPDNNDLDKSKNTKEVHIWVDKANKSLSFPGFP